MIEIYTEYLESRKLVYKHQAAKDRISFNAELARYRKLQTKVNIAILALPQPQHLPTAQTMITAGLMYPQVEVLLTIYTKGRITRL